MKNLFELIIHSKVVLWKECAQVDVIYNVKNQLINVSF